MLQKAEDTLGSCTPRSPYLFSLHREGAIVKAQFIVSFRLPSWNVGERGGGARKQASAHFFLSWLPRPSLADKYLQRARLTREALKPEPWA